MERQLVIDIDRCTGCRMCEMACSLEKEGECSRVFSRIKVVKMEQGIDLPLVCLQCEEAVCMKVCPVRAISRNTIGTIVVDYEVCIGCKVCLALCPFGAISLDPKRRKVIKCDLCGGQPQCVRFCQPKALSYVRKDKVDAVKRRRMAEKIYVQEHGGHLATEKPTIRRSSEE
jgi:carbon-monoxide dehydrogenase iron sulfur subunit